MIEEDILGMVEGIGGTEELMAEWRNKGDEGRVGVNVGYISSLSEGKGVG